MALAHTGRSKPPVWARWTRGRQRRRYDGHMHVGSHRRSRHWWTYGGQQLGGCPLGRQQRRYDGHMHVGSHRCSRHRRSYGGRCLQPGYRQSRGRCAGPCAEALEQLGLSGAKVSRGRW